MASKQIDLNDIKPTPFTLLFSIYGARLATELEGFTTLDIAKQCDYLQNEKINNKINRKQIISDLIDKEKIDNLKTMPYIRIHIKYIFAQFYKECQHLKYTQNINEWKSHEIILSFISHLIEAASNDESQNKKNTSHPKIWEFVNYLRKYFNDTGYNGTKFLSAFENKGDQNNNKPTKGFGLQMMKNVCSKYQLKSGPFSKVKKQCNIWAQKINKQSKGIDIPQKVYLLHQKKNMYK